MPKPDAPLVGAAVGTHTKPDEKPDHPVKEDHPGKGRGENPNPGNKPDKPVPPGQGGEHPIEPPNGDPPHPTQLPS